MNFYFVEPFFLNIVIRSKQDQVQTVWVYEISNRKNKNSNCVVFVMEENIGFSVTSPSTLNALDRQNWCFFLSLHICILFVLYVFLFCSIFSTTIKFVSRELTKQMFKLAMINVARTRLSLTNMLIYRNSCNFEFIRFFFLFRCRAFVWEEKI